MKKILVYKKGSESVQLSDCLRARGIVTRLLEGTVDGLIREIVWGKPAAVIVPPEVQDGSALLFVETAKKELSGREPLFFVYGLGPNLKLCNNLRMAGAENVFLSNTPAESIATSVLASCELDAMACDLGIENTVSARQRTNVIRKVLKANCFSTSSAGFQYLCETIAEILCSSGECKCLRNIYAGIAGKHGVSVHLVEQDVRAAVGSAYSLSKGICYENVFTGYTEKPKPKQIIMVTAERAAQEIRRAELVIFSPINRRENG